jgi:hypothetical protein
LADLSGFRRILTGSSIFFKKNPPKSARIRVPKRELLSCVRNKTVRLFFLFFTSKLSRRNMKKEQFVFIFVVIFLQINLVAASRWFCLPSSEEVSAWRQARAHEAWDKLLQKNVRQGRVNYANFKADKATLDQYLQKISAQVPAANATKTDKIAYWLNVYNALTVQLIVSNYPVKSIKNLDNGNPWDVQRYTFGGKKYSLNQIENDILRPMGDARIHFGLNCAAKSCPPLHNRAFSGAQLHEQLEQLTRTFVNNTVENQLAGNQIKISNIFNWYKSDFGEVITFLNRYSNAPVYKMAKITYMNYDWSLNE